MDITFNEKLNHFVREGTLDDFIVKEINCSYKEMNLSSEDVVMDVGGNIGAFAKWAAIQCKYLISFEPDPDNFSVLLKNLEGLSNIQAVDAALVPGTDPEVKFYLNKGKNKGMHSHVFRRGRDEITVKALNFEKTLLKCRPDKLKIDIEGGEYEILKDFIIPDFVKLIALEIHLNGKLWRNKLAPALIEHILPQFPNVIKAPKITEGNWATLAIYSR